MDEPRKKLWRKAQQRAYTDLRSEHPEDYARLLIKHREELGVGGLLHARSLPPKETA